MDSSRLRKLIEVKIDELNKKSKSIIFEFKEKDESCEIANSLKVAGMESTYFGTYHYWVEYEQCGGVEGAYTSCLAFLDGLLAGMRLLDSKEYHNVLMEAYGS